VGRKRSRARPGSHMTRCDPIVFRVMVDGCLIAMVRHGTVGIHPIHSAACALCMDAIYDRPAFDDVALWIRDHPSDAHGVGGVNWGRVPVRALLEQCRHKPH
jgi:hypothetical protein